MGLDELVEVAVVVTDFDLAILDPGFDIVIKPTETAFAHMNDFVRNMHTESGLIEAIPTGCSDSRTRPGGVAWHGPSCMPGRARSRCG